MQGGERRRKREWERERERERGGGEKWSQRDPSTCSRRY
jgi:hypothetical protein